MVPFRVFDAEKKELWIVLNFHPSQDGGSYLVAKEDGSEEDGQLAMIKAEKLLSFRLVDFLDGGTD